MEINIYEVRIIQLEVTTALRMSTLLRTSPGNPGIICSARRFFSVLQTENLDQKQMILMNEPCIVVDENDAIIRQETKQRCHLLTPTHPKGMLHRAFSVFLFNAKEELLLQQRSFNKITFPGYVTNTCCSHPLYIDTEMTEESAIGVKMAARRRLFLEFGISQHEVPLECLHYMTRIHYSAPSNEKWGENEIDYILIAQKDVSIDPDPNEIVSHKYVCKDEFLNFIDQVQKNGILVTPWFRLIMDKFLFHWWDNLKTLKSLQDHSTIHRL